MTQPHEGMRIGDRYQIEALIGQGGMARVYRARDLVLDSSIALKQLTLAPSAQPRGSTSALFEREFHTLTQLRHPHVIAVYDYGIGQDGAPYYTMELLDGRDIGERAPLPWRDACRISFEVCSALALLHSRRLVHRDLSPRNIRCTLDDRAKLIDFGAMVPMSSGGADVVGTPAFTAPETLRRLALDSRTDLFALGATLYFALTRRVPYPARTFADLNAAWSCNVAPPSSVFSDIPAALDDLVLALINPEPALRPQSAFEVMQLLAACADLVMDESEAVSRAYLVTPSLIGRAELLSAVRSRLERAERSTGILVSGEPGVGRSRFLDACSLEAQTLGFTVLRTTTSASRAAFGLAHDLVTHLLEAHPSSADASIQSILSQAAPRPAVLDTDTSPLQTAVSAWLQRVAKDHPLFIAIDDAERVDAASAALLALLLDEARNSRICITLAADSGDKQPPTLGILARRCHRLRLDALSKPDTHQLLASLFGDVAHLQMLSDEIYRIARGNPRQTIELAQWFLDRGLIKYAAGTWTLPTRLDSADLPTDVAETLRARISGLSPNARLLAEAQALAFYDELEDQQYHELLPELSSSEVERALNELLWIGVVREDHSLYTLTNRAWPAALLEKLAPFDVERRHRALAAMYAPRSTIATIHHAFSGGQPELGLTTMLQQHQTYLADYDHRQLLELNVGKMMWCAAPALETAQRLGYPPRVIHDMRRWHFAGAITIETGAYNESAQRWFEQLAHDSGLDLYRADDATAAADARLMRALTLAQQRYQATPEKERVYSVEEAIRLLGEYVVLAIALGVRSQDAALIRSLPPILEPFVQLSPVLDVLWKNALATMHSQCECKYELAHELWTRVLAKLEVMTTAEFKHVHALRSAVVFALALMELQLGRDTATSWAERLDADPYQRISALNIRKIGCLEQGDRRGADALRRRAEVLSLQMRSPQMFHSLLLIECAACVRARDLSGVRHVLEEMRPLAARHVGWQPCLELIEACFHLIRSDFVVAQQKFEACCKACAPDAVGQSRNLALWLAASQGLAEVLLYTARPEEARTIAAAALQVCLDTGTIAASWDLNRTLGMIEAKLGDARGAERVEQEIALQQQSGASGIRMGLSYEARAQIAIWCDDRAAFEHYAALTAREYRHGARSPLATRYARLLNEAARHGWQAHPTLAQLENFSTNESGALTSSDLRARVMRTLATSQDASQRADCVLDAICAEFGCDVGHLFFCTEHGLVHSASRGEDAGPELTTEIDAWITQMQTRAAELDELVTGELKDEDDATNVIRVDDRSYQVQPLRCVVTQTATLVGVVALSSPTQNPNPRNLELLQVLAERIIQAGDSRGIRLQID